MLTTTLPTVLRLQTSTSTATTVPTTLLSPADYAQVTIVKTIRECCEDTALSKVEKFQVFCHVCDNMPRKVASPKHNTSVTPMSFKVTSINFDFSDDNFELPPMMQEKIVPTVNNKSGTLMRRTWLMRSVTHMDSVYLTQTTKQCRLYL